jgi:hypothetical protein
LPVRSHPGWLLTGKASLVVTTFDNLCMIFLSF